MVESQLPVIFTGPSGVGKTTTIERFRDGLYYSNLESTQGMSPSTKKILLSDGQISLHISDLEGQHSIQEDEEHGYHTLREIFIQENNRAAGLMFDLSLRSTLRSIVRIREGSEEKPFKGYLGEIVKRYKLQFGDFEGDVDMHPLVDKENEIHTIPAIMLFGNKNDLSNRIDRETQEAAIQVLRENLRTYQQNSEDPLIYHLPPIDYVETSAKEGVNVHVGMTLLANKARVFDKFVSYLKGEYDYVYGDLEYEEVFELGEEYLRARESYCTFLDEVQFFSIVLPDFVSDIHQDLGDLLDKFKEDYEDLDGISGEDEEELKEAISESVFSYMSEMYEQLPSYLDNAEVPEASIHALTSSPPDSDVSENSDQASITGYLRHFAGNVAKNMLEGVDRDYYEYTAEVLHPYLKNRYLDPNSNYDIIGLAPAFGYRLSTVEDGLSISEEDYRLEHFNRVTEEFRQKLENREPVRFNIEPN